MQVVTLPPQPLKLVSIAEPSFSMEQFLAFCRANPDTRLERTSEGEIVVVPPAGGESSKRSLRVAAQLNTWADKDGRGEAFESSVLFELPDGSALSPDASWVSHAALRSLSRAERKEFLALAPEFVVEVLSPSDRLKQAQQKMERWIANGVQLAWLIDADRETIHVYRPGQPPKTRRRIHKLAADAPLTGFVLDLRPIWRGLA